MAYINWKDKLYSVGVDHIDEQHKKLVGMLNDLYVAIHSKKQDEIIHDVLIGLVDYTKYHFSSEEEYQAQINYPDIAQHKAQHKELICDVAVILNKLKKGQDVGIYELIAFLKRWLLNHILDEDMKFRQVLSNPKTAL
jgi:hemerythrin